MALWQGKSKRKNTGGRRVYARNKRKFEISAEKQMTVIGDETKKLSQSMGGTSKVRLLKAETANVANPKTRKVTETQILSVAANPADPHYVQRNIITKGAIIKTELGDARVTSRPGQIGVINAVLLE